MVKSKLASLFRVLILLSVVGIWIWGFLSRRTTPEFITYNRMRTLSMALEVYTQEHRLLVSREEQIGKIMRTMQPPSKDPRHWVWEGSYDKEGRLLDAWGRPFIVTVESNGNLVVIKSLGPNGADDGGKYDDQILVKNLRRW